MAEGTPDNPHTYPQGVPSWIEYQATDVDAAVRFYGGLLGWAFEDRLPPGAPARFLLASLGGKDTGSIATADGAPRWLTYIAVDDADVVAGAASDAGGTVLHPPQDAGPAGRWASVRDPQGAEFGLWQAGMRRGSQVNNAANSWNFSDLQTTDLDAGLAYYGCVFGWEVADMGPDAHHVLRLPGYGDHLEATVDPGIRERQADAPEGFADAVAGAVEAEADEGPHWHVSFSVDDRDAAAETAEGLGDEVLGRYDGMWVRSARIRDPWGAEFTLSEFTS
ncbi:VOC family protein [Pseudolysinimonas kribbensis]|uniref:VOC family protein n=1 Tax=Pseudolysinimonas kribbensis TaxID=433641 RepID=UPI0031E11E00